ncbi:hypothetical protein DSO57_1011143 [Entomophthora muscae]|uniref:Uncharacterized protein n=1 Tax=Entomophthora muscae TaxID=34485 RepID=A0ACC2SVH3_9FUNG|nr:hypothetical protein DSO57_1011143 [Entomophthora muscae]
MIIKCCLKKLLPWRQSSSKLCHRKVTIIRVKGKITASLTGWTWICHTHANIHLADVAFFSIGDTVRECHPQAFNDLYLRVLDHNSLFGHQMMGDLFAQIVFHVNMGNQSRKDKRLPPCATATYQPIKKMTDKEYNKRYMAAITCNPPTPTLSSSPPPSSPTHPIPDPSGQHCLYVFLPMLFCLLGITLSRPNKPPVAKHFLFILSLF